MQIRADKPRPTAYNTPMCSERDNAKRWRPNSRENQAKILARLGTLLWALIAGCFLTGASGPVISRAMIWLASCVAVYALVRLCASRRVVRAWLERPSDTPLQGRIRFSVSTLVVVVTLVCIYLGCWEATKRGCEQYRKSADTRRDVSSPIPFIVAYDDRDRDSLGSNALYRHYELWFFGRTNVVLWREWQSPTYWK
jgi:hypothetical protein